MYLFRGFHPATGIGSSVTGQIKTCCIAENEDKGTTSKQMTSPEVLL